MQAFPEYVMQLRSDVRLLRLDKDRLTCARQKQKDKAERLEKQVKEQAKRIKELEEENSKLKREQEQSDKTKKRYQVALFDHDNFRHPSPQPRRKKADSQAMGIPIENAISPRLPLRTNASLWSTVLSVEIRWFA